MGHVVIIRIGGLLWSEANALDLPILFSSSMANARLGNRTCGDLYLESPVGDLICGIG